MSKELTHSQAAILRAVKSDVFTSTYTGSPEIGSDDLSWAICHAEVDMLEQAGEEALQRYHAKYRIVDVAALAVVFEFAQSELARIDKEFAEQGERTPAQFECLRDALEKLQEVL